MDAFCGLEEKWRPGGGLDKNINKYRENDAKIKLMARNHVWRYTLRLFHTFAIFETKYDAKRDLESHCERRALTAAPLGGNRRISISG